MKGRKFHIKCGSQYFFKKYGDSPVTEIESELAYSSDYGPPSFLYVGRALAEGNNNLFHGKTYYGHIYELGEFVHESELGEEVVEK